MLKKISTFALAGLLALPALATAGSASSTSDLAAQVDRLTQELANLKAQIAAMREGQGPATDVKAQKEIADLKTQMKSLEENQKEAFDDLDEKSAAWDLAARVQLFGDFRARGDWYKNDLVTTPLENPLNPGLGFADDDEMENTSIFTNRFRLNMRVKATENVDFKGRLAMYKAWGTNTLPPNVTQFGYPSFDGTSTREPSDSILRVDRAFVNWYNIGGQPIWFSVGRRPTTDGPASQLRMGLNERMATPTAYMDWPFDGATLGYAYANLFGWQDAPGRIRFCYGRGFENGLQYDATSADLNDTDFAGISWDIYNKGNRLVYLQSYMIYNAFNYPEFNDSGTNLYYDDLFKAIGYANGRENVGDVLHTSGVYMDKWEKLNYFVSAGWSRTMPDDDTGMFNDVFSGVKNTDDEDGYNIWIGARYDMDDLGLKFGLEYNHGSQYWIGMTPGHDDMYSAKLATRGDVYEAYLIWDLPTGEAISKFAKTFMRFGYQHYDYDYSGGSDWNFKPYDLDDAVALQWATMMPTIESADQVYVTFEVYF
jgi:ribosomal protein L29